MTVIHFIFLTSYIIHFSRQYVATLLSDPSSGCVDERRYFFNAGAIVSGRKVAGLEGRAECKPSSICPTVGSITMDGGQGL